MNKIELDEIELKKELNNSLSIILIEDDLNIIINIIKKEIDKYFYKNIDNELKMD